MTLLVFDWQPIIQVFSPPYSRHHPDDEMSYLDLTLQESKSKDPKETSWGQSKTTLTLPKASNHIHLPSDFNSTFIDPPSFQHPLYPKDPDSISNLRKRCSLKDVRKVDEELIGDTQLSFELRSRAQFWSKSGERTRLNLTDRSAEKEALGEGEEEDEEDQEGIEIENESGNGRNNGKKRQIEEGSSTSQSKKKKSNQKTQGNPLAGNEGATGSTQGSTDRMELAKNLIPEAFRFHLHPDAMKRFFHTVSTKMDSVIANSAPLWEFKAKYPYAVSSKEASVPQVPHFKEPSGSEDNASVSNALPTAASTSTSSTKPILTIEIYSRTAIRLTRQSLEKQETVHRMWWKERKAKAAARKAASSRTPIPSVLNPEDEEPQAKQTQKDQEGEEEEEEEEEEFDADNEVAPSLRPFLYGPIYHSQTIEVPADTNLDQLKRCLVCTTETLPERLNWESRLKAKVEEEKEKESKKQKRSKRLERKKKAESNRRRRIEAEEAQVGEADLDLSSGSESDSDSSSSSDDDEENGPEEALALNRRLKNSDRHEADLRARFTGRKRKTGCCFMIEDRLYGDGPVYPEADEEGPELNYAKLIHKHLNASRPKDSESLHPPESLSSTTFETLPSPGFKINEPYWMIHQGDCEHYWVVKSIRLPHQTVDSISLSPPANLPSSSSSLLSLPPARILHLAAASIVRPIVLYSRPTGNVDSTQMNPCVACAKRSSKMLVIGGERFRAAQAREIALKARQGRAGIDPNGTEEARDEDLLLDEDEDNESEAELSRSKKKRTKGLDGLTAQAEGLCELCWSDMIGLDFSKEGERSRKGQDKGKKKDESKNDSIGPVSIFKPTVGEKTRLETSEDMSGESWMAWGEGMGGEDWTILPVLD